MSVCYNGRENKETYDLLDDLARGVEVDQALVDLELVAVPGLGTLTARLRQPPSDAALGTNCEKDYSPTCGW